MAKSRMLKTPGAKWPSSPADAPKVWNSKAVATRVPHAIPCLRDRLGFIVILALGLLSAAPHRSRSNRPLVRPPGRRPHRPSYKLVPCCTAEPAHDLADACRHRLVCP